MLPPPAPEPSSDFPGFLPTAGPLRGPSKDSSARSATPSSDEANRGGPSMDPSRPEAYASDGPRRPRLCTLLALYRLIGTPAVLVSQSPRRSKLTRHAGQKDRHYAQRAGTGRGPCLRGCINPRQTASTAGRLMPSRPIGGGGRVELNPGRVDPYRQYCHGSYASTMVILLVVRAFARLIPLHYHCLA